MSPEYGAEDWPLSTWNLPMRRAIIVLAKTPDETRTEFRPVIDEQGAACLHECFLLDTLDKASAVPDADLVICSATGDDIPFLREVSPEWTKYMPGEGMTMNDRMTFCFDQLLEMDVAVVFVTADAPTLPARSLELAFDALAAGNVDVVLGPCVGEGLYLIGMTAAHHELLRRVDWNKPAGIIERLADLGLGWYMLPEWRCIRTAEDLGVLRADLADDSLSGYYAPCTKEYLRELGERSHVRILPA